MHIRHSKTVGVQTIMLKHPIKQKKRTPTKPIYCITVHKNNPLHKLMMTDRQTGAHTHTHTHTHIHTYTLVLGTESRHGWCKCCWSVLFMTGAGLGTASAALWGLGRDGGGESVRCSLPQQATTCTHAHARTHTHTHARTHAHTHTHTHMHTQHAHTFQHTHIHTHTHTQTCTHIPTHTHTHTQHAHTFQHTHTHTQTSVSMVRC